MIDELASPSVCVIDDEKVDSDAILGALNGLFISAVHIEGSVDSLPPAPFKRLRLVFVDLHLIAAQGKAAASHAANVFIRTVSADTAPIVVVIWSKFASELVAQENVPPEDQETEAETFKATLLEAEPRFKERLIFLEMAKPRAEDRAAGWNNTLKAEIRNVLTGYEAVEVLWAWESLVIDGCSTVSKELTAVAQKAIDGTARPLQDGLKATLQKLAKAQGEGDFTAGTAPAHALAVLTSLLTDQLEQPAGAAAIAAHGQWLSAAPAVPTGAGFTSEMNRVLLTAGPSAGAGPFMPGTVFEVTDVAEFERAFGKPASQMVDACCSKSNKADEWRAGVKPVLIELSPVCDVAQGKRVNASMVGGLVIPVSLRNTAWKEGAFGLLEANFMMRWPVAGFNEQDATLVFCHRYRITMPAGAQPSWMRPWFRLRELPTAAIRNLGAAYSARVGYISLW